MSYFVGRVRYAGGSGTVWVHYKTLEEAEESVRKNGGYIVEALDMVTKPNKEKK